jgi:hypothetical protein
LPKVHLAKIPNIFRLRHQNDNYYGRLLRLMCLPYIKTIGFGFIIIALLLLLAYISIWYLELL